MVVEEQIQEVAEVSQDAYWEILEIQVEEGVETYLVEVETFHPSVAEEASVAFDVAFAPSSAWLELQVEQLVE